MASHIQAEAAAAFVARIDAGVPDFNARIELVTSKLTPIQQNAALWLHDEYGMALDLPNLRNMLDYWDELHRVGISVGYERTRGGPGLAFVIVNRLPTAQEFNPAHLIEYFANGVVSHPILQ